MMRNKLLFAFLLLFGLGCSAQTLLLVDSGEPGNEWPSLFVGGYGQPGRISQVLAGQFELSGQFDIQAMQGFLAVNVQGLVEVSILADDNGRPGRTLFSKTFLSESDQFPYFYGWQGTSGFTGRLSGGRYWISFGAGLDSPFEGGMGRADLSAPVMHAEANRVNMGGELGWSNWTVIPLDLGPDTGYGIYARIYGDPVPLPAALWLLAAGSVSLLGARRRRVT